MYKYIKDLITSEVSTNQILRVEDKTFIPFNPDNTDYKYYLEWLAEGNEPLPADE